MIKAIQGRLLVELMGQYKNLKPTEERFGTSKTRGVVKSIASDIDETCAANDIKIGTIVYFGKYEDTAPYTIDGKDYALIKLEEIGGVENA